MESIDVHPGTVSRILWHFTGGPRWNKEARKQEDKPKPPREAYENLCSILGTGTLRRGAYREIVVATRRVIRRGNETEEVGRFNDPVAIESLPVCCLSDIPIEHLAYHAKRYGKFAVGFHKQAVVARGFNPVLYTLSHSKIGREILSTLVNLHLLEALTVSTRAQEIGELSQRLGDSSHSQEVIPRIMKLCEELEIHAGKLNADSAFIENSVKYLIAFVKSFDIDEFPTVYCEREWRSVEPFDFALTDLAMIVLPTRENNEEYFGPFCQNVAQKLDIPRTVPIVPWEVLMEY